ncbi:Hypothetical_protein [Hexamita inflata]|uniref:Hypothetical_protein n=1 Tax=Hexamita inflata TaxID=28002 RepID=A0AA86V4F9_9EUKA|nr:Hypothetical protein HINF_LOCUS13768 [Hexamita inflata]CAI9969460.1 Hypothetical protein HINF_LOCUS57105 [Hexamita inflata]CAI9976121.1 Hypothetical protein HINF_LOCUS63766 [Hexamita inflata]
MGCSPSPQNINPKLDGVFVDDMQFEAIKQELYNCEDLQMSTLMGKLISVHSIIEEDGDLRNSINQTQTNDDRMSFSTRLQQIINKNSPEASSKPSKLRCSDVDNTILDILEFSKYRQ